MIKETKFLEGLYTSEELNPENIKDRNGKIAFLQKLIDIMSKLFIIYTYVTFQGIKNLTFGKSILISSFEYKNKNCL